MSSKTPEMEAKFWEKVAPTGFCCPLLRKDKERIMKSPEQIADEFYDLYIEQSSNGGYPMWRTTIRDAIEADRAQRHDALDRVRAILNAEIGWETPAVLKERIEWALNGEDA